MINSNTIIVRPLEAELIHDVELLGKMDPYVILRTDADKVVSSICKDGAKNPKWNETLTITKGYDNRLIVEVFNDNMIRKDKLVGACEIDLPLVLKNNNSINDWFEIFYNGESAGRILLNITTQPGTGLQQGLGMQQGLGLQHGLGLQQGLGIQQTPNIQQFLHESVHNIIPGTTNPGLIGTTDLISGALLQPQVMSELASTGVLKTNLATTTTTTFPGTTLLSGTNVMPGTTLLPGTTILPNVISGTNVMPGTTTYLPPRI